MDNMVWSEKKEDIIFVTDRTGLSVLAKKDIDDIRIHIWGSLPLGLLPEIFQNFVEPVDSQDIIAITKKDHWLEFYELDRGMYGRVPFTGMHGDIYLSGDIVINKMFFNVLIDFAREKFLMKPLGKEWYKFYDELWIKEF